MLHSIDRHLSSYWVRSFIDRIQSFTVILSARRILSMLIVVTLSAWKDIFVSCLFYVDRWAGEMPKDFHLLKKGFEVWLMVENSCCQSRMLLFRYKHFQSLRNESVNSWVDILWRCLCFRLCRRLGQNLWCNTILWIVSPSKDITSLPRTNGIECHARGALLVVICGLRERVSVEIIEYI